MILNGTGKWVNWDYLQFEATNYQVMEIQNFSSQGDQNPVYMEVSLSYMGSSDFDTHMKDNLGSMKKITYLPNWISTLKLTATS